MLYVWFDLWNSLEKLVCSVASVLRQGIRRVQHLFLVKALPLHWSLFYLLFWHVFLVQTRHTFSTLLITMKKLKSPTLQLANCVAEMDILLKMLKNYNYLVFGMLQFMTLVKWTSYITGFNTKLVFPTYLGVPFGESLCFFYHLRPVPLLMSGIL